MRIKNNYFNEFIFLIGILLIIFASIHFDKNTFFPGSHALFPTIGTFLIIFSSFAMQICKKIPQRAGSVQTTGRHAAGDTTPHGELNVSNLHKSWKKETLR